ncbi:MAG: hypothetical protein ACK4VI_02075 [Alphaproteobacteria bacterium]
MKLLKLKLQIVLTGLILFQIGALADKQSKDSDALPTLTPAVMQTGYSLTRPAYADDNTGIPVDIAYNPYLGSTTSNHGQIQAAARAEAERMLETGDVSRFQRKLEKNPHIARAIGY